MNVVICSLLLAAGFFGQSAPSERDAAAELSADLLLLKDGGAGIDASRKLADQMLAVAHPVHKPASQSLLVLAQELSSAFAGRQLVKSEVASLPGAFVAVLYSTGVGTQDFRESLSRAEKALLSLGADKSRVRKIMKNLAAVGRYVQGPDDIPLAQ